jgi:hypothetical protein
MRIALLDDDQSVARGAADWDRLPAGSAVETFHHRLRDEDAEPVTRTLNHQDTKGTKKTITRALDGERWSNHARKRLPWCPWCLGGYPLYLRDLRALGASVVTRPPGRAAQILKYAVRY